jgi:hypothetical protein
MSNKIKSVMNNCEYIVHLQLPKRTVLSSIPAIKNAANREYIE